MTRDLLPKREVLRQRLQEMRKWFAGFIYGMTYYEMVRTLRRQRSELEHLFMLTVFGDMIGLPILPPYYSLRLLPYMVPYTQAWKRRILREKDLTDLAGD